jgi:hypothetical protein
MHAGKPMPRLAPDHAPPKILRACSLTFKQNFLDPWILQLRHAAGSCCYLLQKNVLFHEAAETICPGAFRHRLNPLDPSDPSPTDRLLLGTVGFSRQK